ncbi:MAG: DUF3136 domain-containing protein [Cyanobium sp.]
MDASKARKRNSASPNYSLYCKALRILVWEGITVEKACRTVCWTRLQSLHQCLPREYRDPEQLFFLLRRELQPLHKA